ncbi:hypothetical protein ACFWB2_32865 [Streptomyces virginiae]|uniref:hypothetical protein n=1 Tax=Streptomyces virginiae TaxID=1961 RepID=UPI0036C9C774
MMLKNLGKWQKASLASAALSVVAVGTLCTPSSAGEYEQVDSKRIVDVIWDPLGAQKQEAAKLQMWKHRIFLKDLDFPWLDENPSALLGHIRVASIKPDGQERDALVFSVGRNCPYNMELPHVRSWWWGQKLFPNEPSDVTNEPQCPKSVRDLEQGGGATLYTFPFKDTYMWVTRELSGKPATFVRQGPNSHWGELNFKDGDRLMIRPNIQDKDSWTSADDDICDGSPRVSAQPLTKKSINAGRFTYEDEGGNCRISWYTAPVDVANGG